MASELDKSQEAIAYVLIEITVDDMFGENPSQAEMDAYAIQFAKDSNARVMTTKALVSYRATPLKGFVWVDSEEDIPKK